MKKGDLNNRKKKTLEIKIKSQTQGQERSQIKQVTVIMIHRLCE
jgi:hypothetical protein